MNSSSSVYLFRAQKSFFFVAICGLFTFGIYVITSSLKFKDPDNALIAGGIISAITLLNYFYFQFDVTRSGIIFCSYRTLFQIRFLPLAQVLAYTFDKAQNKSSHEVQVTIYDQGRNVFATFAVGRQDSEFVAAMQDLNIDVLDAPRISSRYQEK